MINQSLRRKKRDKLSDKMKIKNLANNIIVTWNTAFINNSVMNNTTSVAVRIFMSKQSKQQGFKKLRFISI